VPFEAILAPEKYIAGVQILDVEPHPSASFNATASMGAASDEIYSMMASNFFGEVGSFFLKDDSYTSLKSGVVTDDLRFTSGSVYGARIKLRRSVSGSRDYRGDSGSAGNNVAYGMAGGLVHIPITTRSKTRFIVQRIIYNVFKANCFRTVRSRSARWHRLNSRSSY
jgi:hypothetical protein